ncbi:hypothetical protein BCR33DRAFT_849013 [Rhizoclosmatium globosum]|uniref:G-protein coupled receptors family 2 profile 2 domain-containing protein n=1 Tax=Rhizoclosmatium globosum TaxID=329046 RepID=A0A1Y2CJ01_9FUNG|nr:hypothetical protein BCR33DRAFT_849013 [Rhizoclosmatium globosum]|eukprot:ORY47002.1 hypothetical protein BCR33DRAFT_849013 [Rhizoclosmatium globosum]
MGMTSFSFCITLYCYLTVAYSQKVADKYWIYYFCYGWGLGALFTALLLAMGPILHRGNVIGDATFECWIAPAYQEYRIWFMFLPMWIHFGLILLMYARIFVKVRRVNHDGKEASFQGDEVESGRSSCSSTKTDPAISSSFPSQDRTRRATETTVHTGGGHLKVNKLIFRTAIVTLGYLVSWTPATVVRIIALYGGKASFLANVLIALGFSAAGLWNSGTFFVSWYYMRSEVKHGSK